CRRRHRTRWSGAPGWSPSRPRTRPRAPPRPPARARSSANGPRSVGERVRANLEVHDDGLLALAAFHEPRREVDARRPAPAPLPPGRGVVDASVEALGVEAERVRDAQHDHLAVLEGDQAVVEVAGRHRHVLAEAERVVLVDPRVVARLGAVHADPLEARARILIEAPALRAVIAGRLRPVERPLALAPVEATDVARAHRRPHDTLLVSVSAADPEVRLRNVVDLGEGGGRTSCAPPN